MCMLLMSRRSPDGSLLLLRSETHAVYVYKYHHHETPRLCSTYQAPSPILDLQWYMLPAMASSNHDIERRWCYVISCRDVPTRFVDSIDGSTKASYGIINHVEMYDPLYALTFSDDASWMYAGLRNALALFPLHAVGNNHHLALDLSSQASEQDNDGQHGIVSALAVGCSPAVAQQDASETVQVTAVGTFTNLIGIYLTESQWLADFLTTDKTCSSSKWGTQNLLPGERVCLCGWTVPEGHGITQLAWHPKEKHILVVSMRRAPCLYVYDTSYLYGASSPFQFKPLATSDVSLVARLPRDAGETHQRLQFGMDSQGQYLAAGDQYGWIRIWSWASILERNGTPHVQPVAEWQAHAGTFCYVTDNKMRSGASSFIHSIFTSSLVSVGHDIGIMMPVLKRVLSPTIRTLKCGDGMRLKQDSKVGKNANESYKTTCM